MPQRAAWWASEDRSGREEFFGGRTAFTPSIAGQSIVHVCSHDVRIPVGRKKAVSL